MRQPPRVGAFVFLPDAGAGTSPRRALSGTRAVAGVRLVLKERRFVVHIARSSSLLQSVLFPDQRALTGTADLSRECWVLANS